MQGYDFCCVWNVVRTGTRRKHYRDIRVQFKQRGNYVAGASALAAGDNLHIRC